MNKQKLTKSTVERIAPVPGKQVVWWDTEITGFGVRVSPGGSKTFFYQDRLNGKPKKITIGKFGKIAPEAARKKAKQYQGQIANGEDPTPPKVRTSQASTFGDLLNAYVELLESQGKYSARAVQNAITHDIEAPFTKLWKKPANDITLDDCMAIVGRIKDAGKPRQADKVRSYLRTAFSKAINARGDVNMPKAMRELNVRHNPARDMQKVEGSSEVRDRALTIAEFRSYWRRIQALPEPKRSLAMLHVLTGGQRQQQLARVTLHDIDRDAPSMTIWDSKGKRTKPRRHVIPLLPETLDLIDGITGGGEYVFSCNGGETPIHTVYLNDIAKSVCREMEAAGELEKGPFTAGAIRATIESRLVATPYRVSSDVLAHLLSHGMGGIQQRHYQQHDFFDEKLEALEKLQRLLEGQPEPSADVVQLRA